MIESLTDTRVILLITAVLLVFLSKIILDSLSRSTRRRKSTAMIVAERRLQRIAELARHAPEAPT